MGNRLFESLLVDYPKLHIVQHNYLTDVPHHSSPTELYNNILALEHQENSLNLNYQLSQMYRLIPQPSESQEQENDLSLVNQRLAQMIV